MSNTGHAYRQWGQFGTGADEDAARSRRWRELVDEVQGGGQSLLHWVVHAGDVIQAGASFNLDNPGRLTPSSSCASDLALYGSVAVGTVLRQRRTEIDVITGAIERARKDVIADLAKVGLPPEVADRLVGYVEKKVSTDLALSEIVADEARALYAGRDPAEAVTAADLGALLGVSDETVRNREQAGELFSILRLGRKRGREYPVFQAWEGIAGEPLKLLLAALGRPSGPLAYAFFTSPQGTLGGLSPIEALLGFCRAQAVSEEVREFLGQSEPQRLAAVLAAARTYAAELAA